MTTLPCPERSPSRPCHIASRATAAAALLAICSLPAGLHAAPLLRCQVEQGGDAKVFDVAPVAEPYGVAPIDINGHFRFQAVVVGNAEHVEYVKVYVYAVDGRRATMLHQASYLAPVPGRGAAVTALTGRNQVYSPSLERELQYDCALRESGA